MYLLSSFFTTGDSITTPIILGTTMAKIMASENSTTEFKLDEAPITTKIKNKDLDSNNKEKKYLTKTIDLHGYTIEEANKTVNDLINKCFLK